eukprot:GHVL01008356.1.p1 GENE.GHVL01008356.1~~GHVL01008356.1.p1  ORF type:complete len:606 (+),score=133.15 GHVL01008356.1:34-1818(+)
MTDDPVVRSINVYISDIPEGEMYLLQYPLRPFYRPYGDQGQLESVELRKQQKTLRMKYSLSTETDNHDEHSSGMNIQNQVLNSSSKKSNSCSYAMGYLKNDDLFLVPVDSICQFRPDFKHVDDLAMKNKVGDEATKETSVVEEAKKAQVVEVQYKRREVDQRNISYSKLKQQEESEEWIPLHVYDDDSVESHDIIKIICESPFTEECEEINETKDDITCLIDNKCITKSRILNFSDDIISYINILCTGSPILSIDVSSQNSVNKQSTSSVSRSTIAKLSVDQQVKKILEHFQVVKTSEIQRLLTAPISFDRLIGLLEMFAHCVRGLWVIKTQEISTDTIADANQFQIARDVFLMILAKKVWVKAEEALGAVGRLVQRETVENLIIQLCHKGSDKRLSLKHQSDPEFIAEYKEIVERCEKNNEAKFKTVVEQLKAHLTATRSKDAGQIQRAQRVSSSIEALLRERGALSISQIVESLSTQSDLKAITNTEAAQHISIVAQEIRGVWVLKSAGDVNIEPYRQVLMSIFRLHDEVSKTQVQNEFQLQLQRQFKLADFAFRKLLREFAVCKGGSWVFKGGAQVEGEAMDVESSSSKNT